MKKFLSLLLVIIMILSFAACGNDNNATHIDNTEVGIEQTQGTTSDQNNTEIGNETNIPDETKDAIENETTSDNEGTGDDNTSGGNTETTTPTEDEKEVTKPTETVKPTETTHSHKYSVKVTKQATCGATGLETYTCSCGDSYTKTIAATGKHSWSEWKTTKEPTTTSEGNSQRKCNNCSMTENKAINKLPAVETKPYYVSHEVVKIERPKTFYVDGVDALTLARGENCVQVCDTIKIKVNMSDGGDNFEVRKDVCGKGFSYEKKGNEVWITPDGTSSYIEVLINTNSKNGNKENITIALYDVYNSSANLAEEQEVKQLLKKYGERLGMRYTSTGPEILTMQYTTALHYDNFRVEAFRTLKKWAKEGYTVFTMTVTDYCFDGAAGK